MTNIPFCGALGQVLWVADTVAVAATLVRGEPVVAIPVEPGMHALGATQARCALPYRTTRLTLGITDDGLCGYSDANDCTESLDWYSVSGASTLLNGAVSWRDLRQSMIHS